MTDINNHAEEGMVRNVAALQGRISNYIRWNLSAFPIEKKKKILDIGCGPGLYLDAIMEHAPDLYFATDYSSAFLDIVRQRTSGNPNIKTQQLDILAGDSRNKLPDQWFDYVLCFDVLEHLADDVAALVRIKEIMLTANAELLFTRVPALPWLFGKNDEAIGHYRRYTIQTFKRTLESSGFDVLTIRYQNMIGVIPWYIIGKWLRRSLAVSENEGRLFDLLVPLVAKIEALFSPPFGLSIYCIVAPKK